MDLSFLILIPAGIAALTWIYFKMRDAMWGAFGSRRSLLRVGGFAIGIAAGTFVLMLLFFVIPPWNWKNAAFGLEQAMVVSVACAIFYVIVARLNGPKEIADTIWESLQLD